MKIVAGLITPDHGELAVRGGMRVGYLAQVPDFPAGACVRDAVASGLVGVAAKDLQEALHDPRVDELLSKLELNGRDAGAETQVSTLSGGWQKRVALARALVREPDLLLLDEPTNHLDVESIVWLERFLAASSFATVTVTHDRYFLQRVARRILELDRRNAGGLLDVAGDYATYVERKAEAMAAQERSEQALRNTLRRETEWLRRGPAARTTKQTARIERAEQLAQDVAELGVRNRVKKAEIELEATGRRTKKLIEAKQLGKSFGDKVVFDGLDLTLSPGSRLALLGPNGCGKSTLLRALLGVDTDVRGSSERAPGLRVSLFEQNRAALDPEQTVADSVSPGSDMVDFGGSRLHRHGYLERFLFRPEQMRMRVGNLSGGEQSRLLIARLMLQPADVMVLDEPTNDLDFDTLNVLQEALENFQGAVLLVSHDRYFVDCVATQILAFHTVPSERGRTTKFADLHQWQAWHETQLAGRTESAKSARSSAAPAANKPRKLSYKDQRDWDTLEARILETESKLAALEAEASQPQVASNAARVVELHAAMAPLRDEIERMYARWAELEVMVKT
jgi:ATP-binding cassette subfamily F protein uup